ncbi:HEAT repeat domain-containing protein [Adlercreutzia caecimuris]|uniref:HEAT repeat domain-containing protein n=1 Tax=Adlercreutzia caecimuris TaxID=671266 RepID=UPI00272A816B|nr:HEAT repeat domain-containing protein [Adlercreutzia caecimuris]
MREAVAGSRNAPASALLLLSDDDYMLIGFNVAGNPGSPDAALAKLAKSNLYRADIAWNPGAPEWLLKELLDDDNSEVVLGVVNNRNMPYEALEGYKFKDSMDTECRYALEIRRQEELECRYVDEGFSDEELWGEPWVDRNASSEGEGASAAGQEGVIVVAELRACLMEVCGWIDSSKSGEELFCKNEDIARCLHGYRRSEWPVIRYDGSYVELLKSFTFWLGSGNLDTMNALVYVLQDYVERSPKFASQVAANPETPLALLGGLMSGKNGLRAKKALGGNSSAPLPILATLARDENEEVRASVAGSASLPDYLLSLFLEDDSAMVRAAAAVNPLVEGASLKKLAFDSSRGVRLSVLHNPNVAVDIVSVLAEDEDARIRLAVAESPKTPPEILESMSDDREVGIISAIARNPNTPESVLARYLNDFKGQQHLHLRSSIAKRDLVPEGIVPLLLADENSFVPHDLGANPNADADMLMKVSLHESSFVRYGAARNPNLPDEAIDSLVKDEDKEVRAKIAQNPRCHQKAISILLRDDEEKVRGSLARNPNLPNWVLEILAGDESVKVRSEVAAGEFSPDSIYELLSEDKDAVVRTALAGNPAAPVKAMRLLAHDEDVEVRKALARNPGIDREALSVLLDDPSHEVASIASGDDIPF